MLDDESSGVDAGRIVDGSVRLIGLGRNKGLKVKVEVEVEMKVRVLARSGLRIRWIELRWVLSYE